MKENNDGFVRADQIDLKSLDEQLERHLSRALTMEKNKKKDEDTGNSFLTSAPIARSRSTKVAAKDRLEWEIDPSKLIIKSVIARGTFGTVHRGVYDGLDVAGQSPIYIFALFFNLITL